MERKLVTVLFADAIGSTDATRAVLASFAVGVQPA
jgi:class 3 adenylate cyclase